MFESFCLTNNSLTWWDLITFPLWGQFKIIFGYTFDIIPILFVNRNFNGNIISTLCLFVRCLVATEILPVSGSFKVMLAYGMVYLAPVVRCNVGLNCILYRKLLTYIPMYCLCKVKYHTNLTLESKALLSLTKNTYMDDPK